jgi:hypothetical protein
VSSTSEIHTADLNEGFDNSESENFFSDSKSPSIFLRDFAIENNLTHTALSSLLKYLKNTFPELPKDARTLLKTPRKLKTYKVGYGHYIHFGLQKNIESVCKTFSNLPDTLYLDINIDGLPIYKDLSNNCFWAILGHISNVKKSKVFPIGLYQGKKKPNDFNKFLKKFVKEYLKIQKTSIIFNNNAHKVLIRLFCLDAPARCAVQGIRYYNSKYGCFRCNIKGRYKMGRNCFIGPKGFKKTNSSFRNKTYENFHLSKSIIENIQHVDMVEDFCLDILHVGYLGCMKSC